MSLPSPPSEDVRALTADQDVVAAPVLKRVVAREAIDGIVAPPPMRRSFPFVPLMMAMALLPDDCGGSEPRSGVSFAGSWGVAHPPNG